MDEYRENRIRLWKETAKWATVAVVGLALGTVGHIYTYDPARAYLAGFQDANRQLDGKYPAVVCVRNDQEFRYSHDTLINDDGPDGNRARAMIVEEKNLPKKTCYRNG